MGILFALSPMGPTGIGKFEVVATFASLLGILISLVMVIAALVTVCRARRRNHAPWRRVLGYPLATGLGMVLSCLACCGLALLVSDDDNTFNIAMLFVAFVGSFMAYAVMRAARHPIPVAPNVDPRPF